MTKSKIFLYLCLSFILGIFFASLVKVTVIVLGGFFVFGLVLAAVFWMQNKKIVVAGFCLLIFALGGLRYAQKETVGNLSQLNNKGRLTIVGVIDDLPDRRATSQKLLVRVPPPFEGGGKEGVIDYRTLSVNGLVLVTTKLYPQYQYGDTIEITGQLKEPENFDDFDYKSYLAKSDIYSVMSFPEINVVQVEQGSKLKTGLFWLKQNFASVLARTLPEPQASFMAGLTLGEKKSMPEELTEAFKKTGTTHIVALSGYNIGLIASFIMSILAFFMVRRNWRFGLAVLAIVFFTILTGASASIVRAAIMGVLVLLARQEGRLYNIRNALVFAGAVMVYLNPKILRFDIGFQLSFLATAGLIWLAPVFDRWFKGVRCSDKKVPDTFLRPLVLKLKEILIATLAAQLAVLPLLLIYFSQLSLISPLVNLAILLLIPSTMLLGFAAGIVGMIWMVPAKLLAWISWLYLTLELTIIKFFANLPLSSINFKLTWPLAIIYYLVVIYFLYRFYNKRRSVILVEQYEYS